MRIFARTAAAAAIVSLAAAPAFAASGAPASSLSLRASTASEHDSELAGPIIGIVGVLAIVAGGVIIATQDDDAPDSP